MYRLMQPSDEAAVLALWQSQHHDTEDFAKMLEESFKTLNAEHLCGR